MKRSEIKSVPEYFDRYIGLVDDIDLFEAFDKSISQLKNLDIKSIYKIGSKTYKEGKWTIKEILLHIADVERILAAGTLRFARGDEGFVISFNEDEMSKESKANSRTVEEIIEELISIRESTTKLYKSFDAEDFQKSGYNWKHKITIEAMGFNIIGHQIHHINFIQNHYFPLEKK